MLPDKVSKARWLTGLEKEREYNREAEDIERRLDERRVIWGRLLDLLKGEVTFGPSKRILDIGCEATSIFLALREGEKYALDPLLGYLFDQHPFLKEVEEYRDVHFISSPIEDMASDKSFDTIFMLASLDHMGKLGPIIDKIDELLAPSGMLVIFVDCYKDPAVRSIMSFFDIYLYHPHHFVAEDIVRLFSSYRLKKQEQISEIYHDCPFRIKKEEIRIHRIDKLIARIWQILRLWAKTESNLFALKLFLCCGLASLIALRRRMKEPIHPFTKTQLFVFQKQ